MGPFRAAPLLAFTVLGLAQPAGSKRAFTNPKTGRAIVTDANRKAAPWKAEVAAAAREVHCSELLRGPLTVEMIFYRPRPKSHYRTGRNAHLIRAGAPDAPTSRPDALKLARGVEDALTGIIYADDSQIVDEHLVKRWGEPARVEISIWA